MTMTSVQKTVIQTPSGNVLTIAPGTENPVSVDEMIRRRDAWLVRNKDKLKGYSVDQFIAEKKRDIDMGLE